MSITQKLDSSIINIETLLQQIRNDIDRFDSALPSQKDNFGKEIESKLVDCSNKIGKLNSESRSLNPSQRDYYIGEISSLKDQHNALLGELRKKRSIAMNDPAYKQGMQLEKNIQKAQDITSDLDEAIRIGNNTITTGQATMSLLQEDRNYINHIDENLMVVNQEAHTGVARAKRIVRAACYNNCLVWSIVVLLVALLGFSLYWKLRKH